MELIINKQDNISLNDLIEAKQDGFSVVRSAHAGNCRMYNLILANAGIDMLLVDHNLTAKDKNYIPEVMITDGGSTRLSDRQNTLTMRTKIQNEQFPLNSYIDTFHKQGLENAFPNTNVFTNTEYIRSNNNVSEEIIAACINKLPELFIRKALPDGTTSTTKDSFGNIKPSDILQLVDNPREEKEAIMLSNEVDIVCGFVIEAINTGRSLQYHISGPDMIKYIKGITPILQQIYSLLADTPLRNKLPERLEVELVPGSPLRIASTQINETKLQPFVGVIEALIEYEAKINQEKRAMFTNNHSSKFDRTNLVARIKSERNEMVKSIGEEAKTLGDIINQDKHDGYVSQYDVSRGGGLFVPELVGRLTMSQLQKINTVIEVESSCQLKQ